MQGLRASLFCSIQLAHVACVAACAIIFMSFCVVVASFQSQQPEKLHSLASQSVSALCACLHLDRSFYTMPAPDSIRSNIIFIAAWFVGVQHSPRELCVCSLFHFGMTVILPLLLRCDRPVLSRAHHSSELWHTCKWKMHFHLWWCLMCYAIISW